MTNQSIALFDAVKNTTGGESLKMTSLELADVTNKRHDNVKRTIETLVESGAIVQPQIEDEQSHFLRLSKSKPWYNSCIVVRLSGLETRFMVCKFGPTT